MSNRIELLRERLRRKEDLLSGYEQDLARLHRLEETCSLQDMQVKQLTVSNAQETILNIFDMVLGDVFIFQ